MINRAIAFVTIFSFLFVVGQLQASDSGDLNTNPQLELYPQVASSLEWPMAQSDAQKLLSHIKVLKLIRAGSYEEAIKILESELSKKGSDLIMKVERLKAKDTYEKNIKKDIDSAIEVYDDYRKMHKKN